VRSICVNTQIKCRVIYSPASEQSNRACVREENARFSFIATYLVRGTVARIGQRNRFFKEKGVFVGICDLGLVRVRSIIEKSRAKSQFPPLEITRSDEASLCLFVYDKVNSLDSPIASRVTRWISTISEASLKHLEWMFH